MDTGNSYQLAQSCANLLECTLATYESLCMEKRQRKGELARLEAVLLKTFSPVAQDLKGFVNPPHMAGTSGPGCHQGWRTEFGRLVQILKYRVEHNDSPAEAMHRYFLATRHGNPAHRE